MIVAPIDIWRVEALREYIPVSAASADEIARVAEDIRALMRIRHQILPGEPDDFRVRTLDDIIQVTEIKILSK